MNQRGAVGQRVNVSGYVRTAEVKAGGLVRMELCDVPASLPRKHIYCVVVLFQLPAMAYMMPNPGEHVVCEGKITKKD